MQLVKRFEMTDFAKIFKRARVKAGDAHGTLK
jgi:hypothetical protein